MATYKTPDVYVEEISIFPPSVAEVETAIPAFIGHTQVSTADLKLKPVRIKSMLEFEKLYGKGPTPTISSVDLNDDNTFKQASITSNFYMYDSIRLFYANGGGDCYIVSVGDYSSGPVYGSDTTGMLGGLKSLEKADEPTIILFPDAVKLSGDGLYNLQQQALEQCKKLMDRVAVFDLMKSDPNGDTFRSKIGIKYLKYGMAYTPWINVSLDKNISYRDFKDSIVKNVPVSLKDLTSDTELQALISDLEKAIDDVDTATSTTAAALKAGFEAAVSAYKASKSKATFGAIYAYLYGVAETIDDWASTDITGTDLKTAVKNTITSPVKGAYTTLAKHEKALEATVALAAAYTGTYGSVTVAASEWGTAFTPAAQPAISMPAGSPDADYYDSLIGSVTTQFYTIYNAYVGLIESAEAYEDSFDKSLYESSPLYKNILTGINESMSAIPPSGAIAGVYASVDRDRGVWKAPANVSLSTVIGPEYTFAASELDALNIDVNAGKSINAIRAFTGKGTLVWGARTLAGNDNEWRYIPVRRFYNMVEESIKKSTYWAVFEPNNANTWVKVKGMIENYLTQKWKDGALAGAKADEAFFVKIGLGTTMTAQNILEGEMIVEIGMAVVRPAEFIILKFSHKLQES
jgi:phage tail sheath protein FI